MEVSRGKADAESSDHPKSSKFCPKACTPVRKGVYFTVTGWRLNDDANQSMLPMNTMIPKNFKQRL